MKMKRIIIFTLLVASCLFHPGFYSNAQEIIRDTVKTGIYITSIHDIDFKQKEFAVTFWLWLKYKNREFEFDKYLEVPNAKSVDKSFYTVDVVDGKIRMVMRLQCVMKDSWRIANFPYDKQTLRISVENSQFDNRYLIFEPDTLGNNFDKRFTLRGWTIDSCLMSAGTKVYETAFGDESYAKPRMEFSSFRTRLVITRDGSGLFWKMFLGMYLAFLISYTCFHIHTDSIDSRFGLSVGSLFAVIGNKYIVDSSLPESTSFTLVDTLHGLTLFFILCVVACTAYSLRLVKRGQEQKAQKFDLIARRVIFVSYVLLNVWFITLARS